MGEQGWGVRKTQLQTVTVIVPISHPEAACPAQSRGKGRWVSTFHVVLTFNYTTLFIRNTVRGLKRFHRFDHAEICHGDLSTVHLCDCHQCERFSHQSWSQHPPRNGSSSYLMPCTEAQDGNLITYLNKSQNKPRGLAFCLDKPPEHAYLL